MLRAAQAVHVPSTDPNIDKQFQDAIQAIGLERIKSWLLTLAQAAKEGKFEETYNSLLNKGLNRLENAILLLLSSSNSEDVKNLIKEIVSSRYLSDWLKLINLNPELSSEQLRGEYGELPDTFKLALVATKALFKLAVAGRPDLISKVVVVSSIIADSYVGIGASLSAWFQYHVWTIVNNVLTGNPFAPGNLAVIDKLISIANTIQGQLLAWQLPQARGFLAELEVAARSIDNGWQLVDIDAVLNSEGILKPGLTSPPGGGTDIDLILFKKEKDGGILSFLQVKSGSVKRLKGKVLHWLDLVLKHVQNPEQYQQNYSQYDAEYNVIGFVFVDPQENQEMERIILKTIADKYSNSSIPIYVAWRDTNNKPHVVCYGCGDDPNKKQAVRDSACQSAKICVPPDQIEDGSQYQSPQQQTRNQNSSDDRSEPITVGAPAPPSYCVGQFCIM